jgi:hypothetical protein
MTRRSENRRPPTDAPAKLVDNPITSGQYVAQGSAAPPADSVDEYLARVCAVVEAETLAAWPIVDEEGARAANEFWTRGVTDLLRRIETDSRRRGRDRETQAVVGVAARCLRRSVANVDRKLLAGRKRMRRDRDPHAIQRRGAA